MAEPFDTQEPALAAPSAPQKPSAPPKPAKPQKPSKPRKPSAASLLEPGPAEKAFQALTWAGLPVLLILIALMAVSELVMVRPLWFSDEVRHADVYMRLLGGDWLALNLNGLPYPDKPPLYFWALRGLDALPGIDAPRVFFLGTVLSAMAFTASTWLLARATGHDRRTAFAAGLLTVSCLFVAGLAHYPRMDFLFAAVITLSLACLYRGWIKESAPLWLTLGFALAGVATLIKGPLALLFPVLSSVLFLLWRGQGRRLNAKDGLVGFALMLLIPLAWLAALLLTGRADHIQAVLGPQIAGRMINSWHHAGPWWYYLAALPLACLPWTLLPLFINWWRAAKNVPAAWQNRRVDGGRGWLWITFLSGMLALSAVSAKLAIYMLPLLSALAVLSARALLNLTPGRSRWLFFCMALLFGFMGLAFTAADFNAYLLPLLPETWTTAIPPIAHAYMDTASGLALMGATLLGLGAVLLFFSRRSLPGGALLVTTLGVIVLMQPYALRVAPSLTTMLSPHAQAAEMAGYVAKGYVAAAYRVYPGIYSYDLNNALSSTVSANGPRVTVPDIETRPELDAALAAHPRMAVAMREKDWLRWENKPDFLQVVQRQWIVDQPYVLVIQDRPETDAPDSGATPAPEGAPVPPASATPQPTPATATPQPVPVTPPLPASETPSPAPAPSTAPENPTPEEAVPAPETASPRQAAPSAPEETQTPAPKTPEATGGVTI